MKPVDELLAVVVGIIIGFIIFLVIMAIPIGIAWIFLPH